MKKNLLSKKLFRSVLLSSFILLNANVFACTGFDLEFTALTVTGIVSSTQCTYTFTIKNIGTQAVAIANISIQNYVTPSNNTSGEQAAGGSDLDPYSTDSIQPGGTYSSSFETYPFSGHGPNTDPYIIAVIEYYDGANPGVNDCDLSNNSTFVCLLPNPSVDSVNIISVDITSGAIEYDLAVQNVGVDTLFVDSLTVYNYVSADSAFDAGTAIACDTFLFSSLAGYLTQNIVFSKDFNISTPVSTTTYPYLITALHYGSAVCGPADSIRITRIPATSPTGITNASAQTGTVVVWNDDAKNFTVNQWAGGAANLNYSIYSVTGLAVASGNAGVGQSVAMQPTASGMYILSLTDGQTVYTTRFVY